MDARYQGGDGGIDLVDVLPTNLRGDNLITYDFSSEWGWPMSTLLSPRWATG